MVQGFAITFVGILQVLAIGAAFMLGRQTERPKDKWPKGSMLQGGWQAWRLPLIILVAAAAGITIFMPILAEVGLGNLLPSFSFSGPSWGSGRMGGRMGGRYPGSGGGRYPGVYSGGGGYPGGSGYPGSMYG